ncbi:MAG TPA: aminotransferase, partial [Candidatus Saccharimonadia bacterium]|nr:aminotransferase [Candidatus Saccharimonadia bacterium]
ARVHPHAISHGYVPGAAPSAFRDEFDWTGTTDPTALLALPECLRYVGSLVPGGWDAIRARNRTLALEARALLCESLGVAMPCPDSMIGAIASIPLPRVADASPLAVLDRVELADLVRARGIEAWFHPWACAGGKVLRISAQLYNEPHEYAALAVLLRELADVR